MTKKVKTCPKCGLTATTPKQIEDRFGYRFSQKACVHSVQSWCRDCRSAPKPKAKPNPRWNVPTLTAKYKKATGDTVKRSVAYMRKKLGV